MNKLRMLAAVSMLAVVWCVLIAISPTAHADGHRYYSHGHYHRDYYSRVGYHHHHHHHRRYY